MVLQPVHDIAEICSRMGIKEAILSPGSRCAPLTIAFARHPGINMRTITDERSAGFIAFGMAQKTENPVVGICTSGTAVMNYGPAITEAFYQQVPLILISADRPPEWIDQLDGQTIRQNHVFGDLLKRSFQLPDHYDHPDVEKHIHRIINEAINVAKEFPAGPVHINVPIREPFYPDEGEKLEYSKDIKIISMEDSQNDLDDGVWKSLESTWKESKNILIVAGQRNNPPGKEEKHNIGLLAKTMPVVGDIISNLHGIEGVLRYPDIFLMNDRKEFSELKPDLLVTFGKSVISKSLKQFIRKHHPGEHWHVQSAGEVADTFQSLTKVIRTDETKFLHNASGWEVDPINTDFYKLWSKNEEKARDLILQSMKSSDFGEFKSTSRVLKQLPKGSNLHLANSMPVRLANFVGLKLEDSSIRVAANRGTSGIDGSNGTAVGEAIVANETVVLITGDLAFFYDRNAFWHKYNIPNLKIVLLNNHAGGIFGLIEGPSKLPELEEYFETNQPLSGESTAKEFGFDYHFCNSDEKLDSLLASFFENNSAPGLLEIQTSNKSNKDIFQSFKTRIKKEFN